MKRGPLAFIAGVVLVVIVVGIVFFVNRPTTSTPPSTSPTSSPTSTLAGNTQSFSVSLNTTTASPGTINVAMGDSITITFTVASSVTGGGLTITSPITSPVTIKPGATGSVTFNDSHAFDFTIKGVGSSSSYVLHIDDTV